MTFYLDGAAHTVGLTGDVYQYTEGAGATLVEVTFNQASNTVRYFIGQNALKTAAPGAVSGAEVYNSLAFGVRLLDAFDAAGTQYITNEPNSCTARYNTLETRTGFVSGRNTDTYNNTDDIFEWELIKGTENASNFAPIWDIDNYLVTLIYYDFPNFDAYYEFTMAAGELGYNPLTGGEDTDEEWNWDIWIKSGIYFKSGHYLKADGDIHITVKTDRRDVPWVVTATKLPDQLYRGTLITPAVTQFTINGTQPAADGDSVSVTAGGTTYSGTIGTYSPTSWSFTDASGAVVTLVDADTLTVTTSTSSMINTTETVPVTQPHDDYGIIMLDANQVAGASDEGVAGDSDEVLPQTGGISTPTLIGILGLALIAVGGTCFVVCRRKFLN